MSRGRHRSCVALATICLGLTWGQSSEAATEKRRLLVMDLHRSGPLSDDSLRTISGLLAAELAERSSAFVISEEDIGLVTQLGEDRPQCEDVACVTEVAGALGVNQVVFGRVAEKNGGLHITFGLVDVDKGVLVSEAVVEARNLEQVPTTLGPAVERLLATGTDTSQASTGSHSSRGALEDPADGGDRGGPTAAVATRPESQRAELGETVEDRAEASSAWPLLVGGASAVALGVLVGAATAAVGLKLQGDLVDETSTRATKDAALALGPPVVLGGGAAALSLVAAGSGLALFGLIE